MPGAYGQFCPDSGESSYPVRLEPWQGRSMWCFKRGKKPADEEWERISEALFRADPIGINYETLSS